MSTTLDKASRTMGKIQYHIKVGPGDVGQYVLLPGDPDRVLRIAKYLSNDGRSFPDPCLDRSGREAA